MCQCPNCGTNLALHAVEPLREQRRRDDGGLEPAEMTPERAAAFVLPIGKYRGMTVGDVGARDVEYLRWGAANWDRALGRAVKYHLAQLDSMVEQER